MDTALPQTFPFILDWNLAKANCTGNHVCTSCDRVVLGPDTFVPRHVIIVCSQSCLGTNVYVCAQTHILCLGVLNKITKYSRKLRNIHAGNC